MLTPPVDGAVSFLNDHLGGWNRAMGLRFTGASAAVGRVRLINLEPGEAIAGKPAGSSARNEPC